MSCRSDFQNLYKGAEKEQEKTKRRNRGRVRERGSCGCRGPYLNIQGGGFLREGG